jgi:hypothetical protein
MHGHHLRAREVHSLRGKAAGNRRVGSGRGVLAATWAAALALAVGLSLPVGSTASPPGSAGLEPQERGAQTAPTRSTREVQINADGYTSSRQCGQCHRDIYNSWKKSLHSFSLQDPIFDAAFMQALKMGGEEARHTCLRCHAPTVVITGDYDLGDGVSREGVTCDFCHSVTAVHLDDRVKRYSSNPGLVKRGVIEGAVSPAHRVAYSKLHTTSEFCGGCHNYTTQHGATVLSTYDEWLAGPYSREGIQCQNCHMSLSPGKIVEPDVMKTGPTIHLHDLIHDSDQMRGALSVEVTGVRRTAQALVVDLVVANVGSGHRVPTGIPSRQVVLTVTVEAGRDKQTRERIYQKIVADERKHPISSDYEALLRGAVILNDTRIGPRERRAERFTFRSPRGSERAKITATLSYRYSAPILRDNQLDIKLGEAEEIVP